jgi:hypothetical protein
VVEEDSVAMPLTNRYSRDVKPDRETKPGSTPSSALAAVAATFTVLSEAMLKARPMAAFAVREARSVIVIDPVAGNAAEATVYQMATVAPAAALP